MLRGTEIHYYLGNDLASSFHNGSFFRELAEASDYLAQPAEVLKVDEPSLCLKVEANLSVNDGSVTVYFQAQENCKPARPLYQRNVANLRPSDPSVRRAAVFLPLPAVMHPEELNPLVGRIAQRIRSRFPNIGGLESIFFVQMPNDGVLYHGAFPFNP